MRKFLIPAAAVLLGAAGFILRRAALLTAFEADTGLAVSGAPALLVLKLFTLVAAALLAVLAALTCRGCDREAISISSSALTVSAANVLSGLGYLISGVLTVPDFAARFAVLRLEGQSGLSELTLLLLGGGLVLGGMGMLVTGVREYRGLKNGQYSICAMLPALCCCIWMIRVYHERASDPVMENYFWLLLAVAASLLAWFFLAGWSFSLSRPFRTLFLTLLSTMACMTALADSMTAYGRLTLAATALFMAVRSGVLTGSVLKEGGYHGTRFLEE